MSPPAASSMQRWSLAQAITDKDRADIKAAAEMQADYVAVSFPRSAADIHEARSLLRQAGGHGGIVA